MFKEQEFYTVVYNIEEDKIFCIPSYLITESEGIVHISTSTAFWSERPELYIIGEL